ncbi:MAG: hypothetical protein IPO43_17040 [Rhodoferax sp.]|nr:hypothetical protein [Rhodoferax sp.]
MLSLNRHVEAARAPHHGQAQPALTGRSGGAREHGFVQPDVHLLLIRRRALLQLRNHINDRNLLLRVRELLARCARNQRECGWISYGLHR